MKALAIAAMVLAPMLAAPRTAAADEPTAVPGIPGPGVNVPPPAPAAPAPAPAAPAPAPAAPAPAPAPAQAPAPPAPKADPAYNDYNPDVRDFPAPKGKDVVVIAYPERSKSSIILVGSLAAGGVILGAVGLYFHLDARSASDEVSASSYTGEPWSDDKQAAFDRAHSSGVTAGVFYGIGGGLLLATAIAYIATEPKAEKMVIHPHSDPKPSALVAPVKGGAIVGGAWRF